MNWEDKFGKLGEYTSDTVNALNNMAGAKDDLTDYEKKIKSSFENARKAIEEGNAVEKSSDGSSLRTAISVNLCLRLFLKSSTVFIAISKNFSGKNTADVGGNLLKIC